MNDHAVPRGVTGGVLEDPSRKNPMAMKVSESGLRFIWCEEYRKSVSEYLHWPGGASGVTIGAGYDLGCRTRSKIISDLTAIGVNPATSSVVAAGAGLKGEQARLFVKAHRGEIILNEEMGVKLLQLVLKEYESNVRALVKVKLKQNEYDALVSFAYNPGGRLKRVAKMVNQGDIKAAMSEITAANSSGGQVLPGLVKRRKNETDLFIIGRYR
jgi:Phage-related lysozyme (muraminidase)